ncbi:MAG: class I SAM-dependent methyltransferase [Phycisphaerales bacterium]|nr:MAG: class I SAM-dependent methyltransferase [Phycisphaerales bacterium]
MSAIIRRRSTNAADVREIALDGFDLSLAKRVLDLGCGFGFMAEAVAPRVAPEAEIVGVDVWQANQPPFLERVAAHGRRASFNCMNVGWELPWPDGTFDLVICSYSLYFFAEVLPEIPRVLTPNGTFLALTHSRRDFPALALIVGLSAPGGEWLSIISRFSAENGGSRLGRWFGQVERVNYPNTLVFGRDEIDDLLAFLHFKLPLLLPGWQPSDELPPGVCERARKLLSMRGKLVIEKNDAVFRCRKPRTQFE